MTDSLPQQVEITNYPCGVNAEEGIRRVANNKKLYDKLLFRIASELPQNIAEFENSLSSNDFVALSMQAHTLKGSSANLSITTIQEAALQLELAAKSQDTSAGSVALEELKLKATTYMSEIRG